MKKIVVHHEFYGCRCECCGTEFLGVEIIDGQEYNRKRLFEFAHFEPDEIQPHIERYAKANWPDWVGVPIEIGDLSCPAA